MGSSDFAELQAAVTAWHRYKYPEATLSDVGLKLAEEAGEACRAIDRIHYAEGPNTRAGWEANLAEEIGQVCMVLIVLSARLGLPFEKLVSDACFEVMSRDKRRAGGH